MATYTYSLSGDFGGNIKAGQLHTEISEEVGITGGNILRIDISGDDVDIVFDATLSAGEQTTLDGLVSAHIPVKNKSTNYIIHPKKDNTNSNSYFIITSFKYDGSDKIGTIDYIELVAYKDTTITSYDARVVVKSSGLVVAEKTGMTNDDYEIQDLGTISNVPTGVSILELQIKKNGGAGNKYIEIEQLIIYHGN